MANALIIYSNPSDTARIRLDKEHRALDQVLKSVKASATDIDRQHAASRSDLALALSSSSYKIIHFSGHGSEEGFYMESDAQDSSEVLNPADLRDLLIRFQPDLLLVILMSCYSATAVKELIEAATYLITVEGPADDDAAISFTSTFYEVFLKYGSVEKAFGVANFINEQELNAVLTRRAIEGNKTKQLIAVYSKRRQEPMYMDLSEAEQSIINLGLPREYVVSTLGRKIHVHRWIFEEPRDRAVLSVGAFFGIFSWKNPEDVIVCHKILKLRPNVSETLIQLWAQLIVSYNDLYMSEYRLLPTSVNKNTADMVEHAIFEFKETYNFFFASLANAELLAGDDATHFSAIRATLGANLEKASQKLSKQEYSKAIIFLETALSSIHDFIESLVIRLADE